jgi:hypothetical protein
MLDKIKILLGLADDSKDDLLNILIALCKDEAVDFCNLTEYSNKLDSAIIAMVVERYNKLGTEGLSSVSTNGITEDYLTGYSEIVRSKLRKNRKVKCV